MSLQAELDAVHANFMADDFESASTLDEDTDARVAEGIGKQVLQVGANAPDFTLPDQLGNALRLADLLANGPVVLNFYRGIWCPYCSLELRALQQRLPQIEAAGARLVAISPQLPDASLKTAEKNELTYPVLSDVGNEVSRLYGLVFTLSESIRPMYEGFGIDLPALNGSDSFELPIPGTFVIARSGQIIAAFADPDYKIRMEPEAVLAALQ